MPEFNESTITELTICAIPSIAAAFHRYHCTLTALVVASFVQEIPAIDVGDSIIEITIKPKTQPKYQTLKEKA